MCFWTTVCKSILVVPYVSFACEICSSEACSQTGRREQGGGASQNPFIFSLIMSLQKPFQNGAQNYTVYQTAVSIDLQKHDQC